MNWSREAGVPCGDAESTVGKQMEGCEGSHHSDLPCSSGGLMKPPSYTYFSFSDLIRLQGSSNIRQLSSSAASLPPHSAAPPPQPALP